MEGMFPLGTGVSRVRAIIGMLKQRGGSMSMSELAEESEEDIDDLLPLIDACKLLGLATIRKSTLQLTDKGRKLTFSNFSKTIKDSLPALEPFKSTILILGDAEVPTKDLFTTLKSRGIVLHEDEAANDQMLKKLLIRWGVRSKLLTYDAENDAWRTHR